MEAKSIYCPGKEMKFDIKESFEINIDNNNYELIIAYNEQLMYFEINEKNKFLKEDDYNIYLNLEELGKINRFFFSIWNFKRSIWLFKRID